MNASVKDTHCDNCQFRISEGVYVYMAGSRIYCQRCVRGPKPYGRAEMVLPTQRLALDDVLPISSPI